MTDFPNIPHGLYPIVLIQDRYSGTYSGGEWLAIREATTMEYDGNYGRETARAPLLLHEGPNGDDGDAMAYWCDPPDWIAVGRTPNEAVENLINGVRPKSWASRDEENDA